MRTLHVPVVSTREFAAESDVYLHLSVMKALDAIEPGYRYVWARRGDEAAEKAMPRNAAMFFEEPPTMRSFYQQMAAADLYRLVDLFGWQTGLFPVDVVFSSRAGVGPLLQLAMGAGNGMFEMPVVLTEPRVYGPGVRGHNTLTPTQVAIRAAGYATCFGMYWSRWEKAEALEAAKTIVAPGALEAWDRHAHVVDALVNQPKWEVSPATRPEERKRLIYMGRLNCLPPDELVVTSRGPVRIADVPLGNTVLGSDGGWHRVEDAPAGEYDGDLIELRSAHLMPARMTPGHHVRVSSWRPQYDVVRSYRTSVGRRAFQTRRRWADCETRWLTADEVERLMTGAAELPAHRRPRHEVFLPLPAERDALISEDEAWLIGLFAGDGWLSSGDRAMQFALNVRDREIALRVASVARAQWDARTRIEQRQDDRGRWLLVTVTSTRAARWMREWVSGRSAPMKRLAQELVALPAPKATALLSGLDQSDGCRFVHRGYVMWSFASTSQALAFQYQMLSFRLGFGARVTKSVPAEGALGTRPVWRVGRSATAPTVRWADAGVYLPLRRARRVPYVGPIHDLTIEGAHEYVGVGGLVHNSNKRWHELLAIMASVYQQRDDVEVWVHAGTGAFDKLKPSSDHRWHRTSERLPFEEYRDLMMTAHVGAYLSVDEGANVTVQEMIVSGITLVLPDRPWVHKLFWPHRYPYVAKTQSQMKAMIDWCLDHYAESFAALADVREMIGRERSWDPFVAKVGKLMAEVQAVRRPQAFRTFRAIALELMTDDGIPFSRLRQLKPDYRSGRAGFAATRNTYACYQAVRDLDDLQHADPQIRRPAA